MSYDTTLAALSPIAWWKLNEAAGAGSVADSSGNSHTGTVVGGVTLGGAGPFPNETGVSFNGSTGEIDTSYSPSALTAFTLIFWYLAPVPTYWAPLVIGTGNIFSGDLGFNALLGTLSGVPTLSAGIGNGGGAVTPSITVDNTAGWHMATIKADGTTMEVLVDGVSIYTASTTITPGAASNAVALSKPFGADSRYTGALADMALFSYALTNAQILSLWQSSRAYITAVAAITGRAFAIGAGIVHAATVVSGRGYAVATQKVAAVGTLTAKAYSVKPRLTAASTISGRAYAIHPRAGGTFVLSGSSTVEKPRPQRSSTAFASAIALPVQTIVSVVEVWTEPTATTEPEFVMSLDITTGTVTDDETAITRRTCQLSAFDPTGTLTPSTAADILHPDSGNELLIKRGLVLPDGRIELVKMGRFRISNPVVQQDANGVAITISGNDRMSLIQSLGWRSPRPVQGNITAVIFDFIDALFPGVPCDFDLSSFEVPLQVFGGVGAKQQGTDPATDITGLATAAGMMLFFGDDGQLILRNVATPPKEALFEWTQGDGCTFQEIDRGFDVSKSYDTVVVESNSSTLGSPLQVVVYVPPRPAHPRTFTYTSPAVTSQAQAYAVAYGLLYRLAGAMETVNGQMTPDPRAQAGDTASLSFPTLKIAKPYTVQSITTPLDPGSQAAPVLRPQLLFGIPPGIL